ncbi:ScbA/BarX family gamma-butyrolactone biosynthesis protein [Streptomyces sp. NPDC006879]|uniref:ScbA/BarX family gamma-butyrolactone biosynthesis protein n=1 Tax=Streptomyces sp. NPDC006879 TaxID=3364767 RepID=UPI0036CF8F0A
MTLAAYETPLPTVLAPTPGTTTELPHLTTTVPREYVHKAALAEVLLTGWRRTASDSFTITAQWPRAHSFFAPIGRLHDPLLLAETVRQTFPLLSHVAYDVPFGHHLIWDFYRYTLTPDALATGERPAEITLHLDCEATFRGNRFAGLSMQVLAVRDGVQLGRAEARFSSHTPTIYRRWRGAHADLERTLAAVVPLPLPVPAHRVGRDRSADVTLSATEDPGRWQLRVDTSHPVLFDHPCDHIPGALLLEAARQAAHALPFPTMAVPTSMDVSFSRFAELDMPCWITAEHLPETRPGRARIHVTARQDGREVFSATVGTEHLAPAPRIAAPLNGSAMGALAAAFGGC